MERKENKMKKNKILQYSIITLLGSFCIYAQVSGADLIEEGEQLEEVSDHAETESMKNVDAYDDLMLSDEEFGDSVEGETTETYIEGVIEKNDGADEVVSSSAETEKEFETELLSEDSEKIWSDVSTDPANTNERVISEELEETSDELIAIAADLVVGWKCVDGNWYYYNEDGTVATGFREIDGETYYFNEKGCMAVEWSEIGGSVYYFGTSGAMQTGWKYIEGYSYYFDFDGKMQTGWIYDENGGYYLEENGQMHTGWLKVESGTYYFNGAGYMQTGWKYVEGNSYYFGSDGKMQTGWIQDGEQWYLADEEGHLKSGWYQDGEQWYYLTTSTGRLTGFQQFGDATYYFNKDGVLQTGWQQIEQKWYLFNSSGVMRKGWYYENGKWYYLDPENGRVEGLQTIEGSKYYFDDNGVMASNQWQEINGESYYFRTSGVMQNGVMKKDGKWYRVTSQGIYPDESISENYAAVYDVSEFGAKGNDTVPDGEAIAEALRAVACMDVVEGIRSLVRIMSGEYYLDRLLYIYSNTDLVLDEDTRIIRLDPLKEILRSKHMDETGNVCQDEENCTHGGYSQIQNVSIAGGIWDGNVHENNDDGYIEMFYFKHGDNIEIKDTTLTNSSANHMIVCDGVSNVTLDGVTFSNTYLFNGEDEDYFGDYAGPEDLSDDDWRKVAMNKEAVHFDFTNAVGSNANPLDNTVCENIKIVNCIFENVLAGIGAHHSEETLSGLKHLNFTVNNNVFRNLLGNAINGYQIDGLKVSNNICTNARSFLEGINSAAEVIGNEVNKMAENGILLIDSNVSISGNVVTDTESGYDISILDESSGICNDNTITACMDENIFSNADDVRVENNHAQSPFTGWKERNDVWYYYENGVRSTGWKYITGDWYYLDKQGVRKTGWNYINGKMYYFDEYGKMESSIWKKDGNYWYFLNDTGAMQTGWRKIASKWYYFNGKGEMQTGWRYIDGKSYYFNGDGAMETGWRKENGVWYYLNASGVMATGWGKIASKWYYFNGMGAMQTGWRYINGYYYFFNESGAMQTGWIKEGTEWYYLSGTGAMQTGWYKVSSKWYYFNGVGIMQTGWKYLNNTWYYLNLDGSMQTGWFNEGSSKYYFDASGKMCTGTVMIGGKEYTFDASGKLLG